MEFKKITHSDMPLIWDFLKNEKGKTTDFSYGGILMWIDYFQYEFAIENETLFIKGLVENDRSKVAFSLPIGPKPFKDSLKLLQEYCNKHHITLELSAVPEYALEEITVTNPKSIEELTDWGDYLYDMEALSTLSGKKMSKKRNHVHQFLSNYPEWSYISLTSENADEALKFMDIFEKEGDLTPQAEAERLLNRQLLNEIKEGDKNLEGGLLIANGQVCAFTIGDIKGDTLFVHVEKATRHVLGAYEMINYIFAQKMKEKYPDLIFINREDDAGDPGLRFAKESYHPIEILKKYNVIY